jgi:hypothetical protein
MFDITTSCTLINTIEMLQVFTNFVQSVGCYQRYAEMFEESSQALDAALSRGAGAAAAAAAAAAFALL